MPLWLVLLLFGAGVAVAAGGSARRHDLDDETIKKVTQHALVAEADVTVLRKLQDLLSHAGYFELAGLVKARAQAFDNLANQAITGSIHAPKVIPQAPNPNQQTLTELKAQLATSLENYAKVSITPYALTHPAFLAAYQKNIADLKAKIASLGG